MKVILIGLSLPIGFLYC